MPAASAAAAWALRVPLALENKTCCSDTCAKRLLQFMAAGAANRVLLLFIFLRFSPCSYVFQGWRQECISKSHRQSKKVSIQTGFPCMQTVGYVKWELFRFLWLIRLILKGGFYARTDFWKTIWGVFCGLILSELEEVDWWRCQSIFQATPSMGCNVCFLGTNDKMFLIYSYCLAVCSVYFSVKGAPDV